MNDKLVQVQNKLISKILIPKKKHPILPHKTRLLALDIQYSDEKAYIGAVYQPVPEGPRQVYLGLTPVAWEYQAGLFAFREGIPLFNMLSHICKETKIRPNLLLLDSHGIAHPRKMGLATWLGIYTGLPSVGCAKKSLLPYSADILQDQAGAYVPIYQEQEVLGYVLRRKAAVKPVFVSPGYKVHPETARDWVAQLAGEFRIPDIQREADQAARRYAKADLEAKDLDLGRIPDYMKPTNF